MTKQEFFIQALTSEFICTGTDSIEQLFDWWIEHGYVSKEYKMYKSENPYASKYYFTVLKPFSFKDENGFITKFPGYNVTLSITAHRLNIKKIKNKKWYLIIPKSHRIMGT